MVPILLAIALIACLLLEIEKAVPDPCGACLLIDHDEMEDMGYKVMANSARAKFLDAWGKARDERTAKQQACYLTLQGIKTL